MLFGKHTKNGTGIEINGDYYDLQNLYLTIERLSNTMDQESGEYNVLMEFSYEIRKAYEDNREFVEYGFENSSNYVRYKSFRILWPIFLISLNVLRKQAGYTNTTLETQATLYRLEYIGCGSLIEMDEKTGSFLKDRWIGYNGFTLYGLWDITISEVIRRHLSEKNGKARFKKLPHNMRVLIAPSNEHEEFMAKIGAEARALNCNPEELSISDEIFDNLKWEW